ncbi:MAG: copper-binding protein [Rouxiella aceris]|uniref:copper-binding protein n=1 Tax=Rouxiella aceris TaxID=2703884 RepID=UPI00284AEA2C|nr:copper-binding protein [Rouxiella aceris]MDR3434157.1 copper-binding protein [Rouxiella aceris]
MRRLIQVALIACSLTTIFSAQAAEQAASSAAQQQLVQAQGVVKEIDYQNSKVSIAHQAIPAISWPAMTMRFTFASASQLSAIKVGDQVHFSFVQQGPLAVLKNIAVKN